jgi:hypothetical protein
VKRRLHERRVGDRAGDRLDRLGVAAHDYAADAASALAVRDHQHRELSQHSVERLAEGELVGRFGLDT